MKSSFTLLAAVMLSLTLGWTRSAQGAVSPLGLSIVPPIQFPGDDDSIAGLRISPGFGDHRDIYGIDLGVVGNITRQEFTGIGIAGGFNINHGTVTAIGLQAAGLTNINYQKTTVIGLQVAAGANYNEGESQVYGFQLALANLSEYTVVHGAQLGVYNSAKAVYGLQVGIVNVATNLHGLQIGLVNFHHQGIFAVSPILNFGF